MAKVNKEKASDAWTNPPHPGDPTSDVTRDGGEPLHKPPQEGAWMDADGEWHAREEHADYAQVTDDSTVTQSGTPDSKVKAAAVPGATGRDFRADGKGGAAQSPYLGDGDQAQEYRDDPMPDGASERVEWVQRGANPGARINAAIAAEEARTPSSRTSVLRKLRDLQREARRNEDPGTTESATATVTDDSGR